MLPRNFIIAGYSFLELLMRFAKYGKKQLIIFGTISLLIAVGAGVLAFHYVSKPQWAALITLPFIAIFYVVVRFFRDPVRNIPKGENRFVAPADGMIFDIGEVKNEFMGGECIRIGIFLSVFDVHINRWPCSGEVAVKTYKRGKFGSAMSREASSRNESNFVGLINCAGTDMKVGVKQIAGLIARTIVCEAKVGDKAERGAQFGMIKFGSRTELFLPKSDKIKVKVKVGISVKAGETILAVYEEAPAPGAETKNDEKKIRTPIQKPKPPIAKKAKSIELDDSEMEEISEESQMEEIADDTTPVPSADELDTTPVAETSEQSDEFPCKVVRIDLSGGKAEEISESK